MVFGIVVRLDVSIAAKAEHKDDRYSYSQGSCRDALDK